MALLRAELLVVALVLTVLVAVVQAAGVLTGWVSAVASLVYLAPIAYVVLVLWLALVADRGPTWRDRWFFVVVLPTMHVSWGIGFITGLLRGARDTVDTSRTGI